MLIRATALQWRKNFGSLGLSLSETPYSWRTGANRVMLLPDGRALRLLVVRSSDCSSPARGLKRRSWFFASRSMCSGASPQRDRPSTTPIVWCSSGCIGWFRQCSGVGDRQAGDGDPLAPRWLPSVLALEIQTRGGRPKTPLEIRQLIRDMSLANPLWGAPRIHGELLKLGIDVGQTTVAKYMARRRRRPSQGWRTFLCNHADGIASMDLFVVPTLSFRLLYGLLILEHGRRQIMWLGVTANPTAEWIARQLTEAYGWEAAPEYIVRDRDAVYGDIFIRRLRAMGIRDRPTAPRSPWQNGYAERLIGSIRRDAGSRRRVWRAAPSPRPEIVSRYYNEARTHLSLSKDAPVPRDVQAVGRILCLPILGGLHHQYVRI